MSDQGSKVHFDRDGRPRCGRPQKVAVTADEAQVTCLFCLKLLAGTNNAGREIADPKPCGTSAAYRRHLRHEGAPVKCRRCLQAESRRTTDGPSRAVRRDRYREAREAGATVAEANRRRDLRRAA